jgi:hypothetical protein
MFLLASQSKWRPQICLEDACLFSVDSLFGNSGFGVLTAPGNGRKKRNKLWQRSNDAARQRIGANKL